MPRTSDKAQRILEYVNQFVQEHGYAPSVREIGAAVGLKSTASVSYHIQALQEQGLLVTPDSKGRKRSIVTNVRPGQIPVIGVVTAGVPILRNRAIDWTTPTGSTLRIIGLGDWNEGDEAPATCMQSAGQSPHPVLLLSHDPESRWLLRSFDWDLMLSGHTHGGQAANPFTGDFISFRSSTPAGLYDFEGNRRVFVTRGVGSTWGMRFFCNPELNILEVND